MATEGKRRTFFISCVDENSTPAQQLALALKRAGYKVWFYRHKIPFGGNIPDYISKALEESDVVFLLWSKAAKESKWVKMEWTSAVSIDKQIIPCLLDDTQLPAILASNKCVSFVNDIEQGLLYLLAELAEFDTEMAG